MPLTPTAAVTQTPLCSGLCKSSSWEDGEDLTHCPLDLTLPPTSLSHKGSTCAQYSSLWVSTKNPCDLQAGKTKGMNPESPIEKTCKAGHVGTATFGNCWNYPGGSHSHLGQVEFTLLDFFFFFLVLLPNSMEWEKHQNSGLSFLLVFQKI